MAAKIAFDPPSPTGAGEAASLLKEAIRREDEWPGLARVEQLLAGEAASRTGIVADIAPMEVGVSIDWPGRARLAANLGRELNAFVRIFSPDEAFSMMGGRKFGAGLLENVPFAFKDVFFADGHRPSNGTRHRFPPREATQSTLLSRLFAAGAVPIGATNLDPFSYSPTGENPFYGAPVNPRDPELLVGGSSSGSSVAVAAGIVPFAIGTDTGGSIRIPAAFCGVWGWKPTNGLLSSSGVVPLSPSHDCPAVVAVSGTLLYRVAEVLIDDTSPARRSAGNKVRIGVAEGLFAASDPDTRRALEEFLGVCNPDQVQAVAVPDLMLCNNIATVVTGYEAARFLESFFNEVPETFTENVRQRLAIGAAIERQDYDAAQRIRSRLTVDFLSSTLCECDVVVSPITPSAFYRREELNGSAEAVQKLTLELLKFNRWVNSLGLPAVAIPLQLSGGQRVAVQIIGRPYADLDLLRLAARLPL